MELLGVRLELPANTPVVLLREQEGDRVLPIYIGAEEAKAIAVALEGMTPPRPMTHDLLRDVLGAIGADLTSVRVTELRDRTFYAELELRQGDRTVRVSSRPSDAIALAVRIGTPIHAEEALLDAEAYVFQEDEEEAAEEQEEEEVIERFQRFIEDLRPEDFAS